MTNTPHIAEGTHILDLTEDEPAIVTAVWNGDDALGNPHTYFRVVYQNGATMTFTTDEDDFEVL